MCKRQNQPPFYTLKIVPETLINWRTIKVQPNVIQAQWATNMPFLPSPGVFIPFLRCQWDGEAEEEGEQPLHHQNELHCLAARGSHWKYWVNFKQGSYHYWSLGAIAGRWGSHLPCSLPRTSACQVAYCSRPLSPVVQIIFLFHQMAGVEGSIRDCSTVLLRRHCWKEQAEDLEGRSMSANPKCCWTKCPIAPNVYRPLRMLCNKTEKFAKFNLGELSKRGVSF